jgi:hypothetical protein
MVLSGTKQSCQVSISAKRLCGTWAGGNSNRQSLHSVRVVLNQWSCFLYRRRSQLRLYLEGVKNISYTACTRGRFAIAKFPPVRNFQNLREAPVFCIDRFYTFLTCCVSMAVCAYFAFQLTSVLLCHLDCFQGTGGR